MHSHSTTAATTSNSDNGQAHGDELFALFAERLQSHIKAPQLDEAAVKSIVDEAIADAKLPRPVVVQLPDGQTHEIDGIVHQAFEEILALIEEGATNIYIVGPAGTGKTTLAKQVAKALGRQFGMISLSAGVTETHLFGRLLPQADGTWKHQPSRFVDVYENGGVFLLDELDSADANVMVSINAALANGVMANPNGQLHERHADTIIIAAANTFGRGADAVYVGRNALDGASLDRFVLHTVEVDYDADLERSIAHGICGADKADEADELLRWVWDVRAKAAACRLRRIVSTRVVENGAKAIAAGRSLDAIKARFFRGWSAEEIAKVA